MKILGIDPSYTNTGIALVENSCVLFTTTISGGGSVWEIEKSSLQAIKIVNDIEELVITLNPDVVVTEYPILATPSGAYLGFILQELIARMSKHKPLYLIPAVGLKSYSKTKTKAQMVKFINEKYSLSLKTSENDIADALCVVSVFKAFKEGTYKNTVKKINYGKERL